MILVENLSKNFGTNQAIQNLSFSVNTGEIIGFLGPNGAGKSTTMNILTGMLSMSSGQVCINGHDIFAEPQEVRRSIGYLPEQPPLYPEFTVREYLHHICGLKKLDRKIWPSELERVLSMCALEDMIQRKIANLSKGYRQRVGLAQALIAQPPLLIFDEPSVGLDPQQILEIRSLIKELGKEHTILLSSHILSEVEAVCSRMLILNRGKLVADDTVSTLSQRLSAEAYHLTLELVATASKNMESANQLANILQQQGIRDFSLRCKDSERTLSLFELEFQLPIQPTLPIEPTSPTNNEDLHYLHSRLMLSKTLEQGGFSIVSMVPRQQKLEEIFLNLTQTEPLLTISKEEGSL